MSLFLLVSMKWLCRIFPFYSPFKSLLFLLFSLVMFEESNLLFRICLQKIGLFLPSPLFIQPPSWASAQVKQSCQSQVFCPGSTTVQPTRCKHIHSNSITIQKHSNILTLHHHVWKSTSLLLQISY